jgi:hypothetical protein
MEKFLEIYNDADGKYVLISANRIKFVAKQTGTNADTWIYYNAQSTDEDIVQVETTVASSGYEVQNEIIDAIAKIASEDYTKSSLKLKLSLEVASISII